MSRSSLRQLARRPVVAVVLLAGHGAGRLRLQVRRRLRPAAAGQQGRAPTTPIEVTADFADALNVVPRTAVFANDVPVGQVTDV